MNITKDIKEYSNIINGKLVPSSSGRLMDSINPATGEVWAKIPLSVKEDVDAVMGAARNAFSNWSTLSARERGDYLRLVGDKIDEYREELIKLEIKSSGGIVDEYFYLLTVLQQIWYDAAGAASLVGSHGKTVQMEQSAFGYTLREPLGVILGIIPWNAPLFTFTIKAAYALAAGNTVVIKPSEYAAVAAIRYGEIIGEILPPGVLNVISGLGSEIGDLLVGHKEVNKISMTGSIKTAEAITRTSAKSPKPLIFELGGKSANIVFEDADLDKAVDGVINAIFTPNAGQLCAAGSRILIQRSIYEEVLTRIKEKMSDPQRFIYGDTLNPSNTMGPLANLPHYNKVRSYIEVGLQEAELVFGGRSGGDVLLPDKPEFKNGYWVEPTLFKADNNSVRICQEEVFGPVAVAIPFDTEEDSVKIANDTSYGLAAGVWTSSLQRAHRVVPKLDSGSVWVNTYFRVTVDLPFGGFKESGYGTDSILEFTREKACVIELGE